MAIDLDRAAAHVDDAWSDGVVDAIEEFISIPNVSPAFDAGWRDHGHMDRAVQLVRDWCGFRQIDGLTVEVHELAGRTPVIVCEIPATTAELADDTVLLYGHLDKLSLIHI